MDGGKSLSIDEGAERVRRWRSAWRDVARLEGMLGHPVPLDGDALGPALSDTRRITGGGIAAFGPPCIDVIALERELERAHGPIPEGESMADSIARRHGAAAVAIIARLLENRR